MKTEKILDRMFAIGEDRIQVEVEECEAGHWRWMSGSTIQFFHAWREVEEYFRSRFGPKTRIRVIWKIILDRPKKADPIS